MAAAANKYKNADELNKEENKLKEEGNKLNEEGNNFYKDGNLLQAIEKYQEAMKLDPNAPKPSRNLSAAYYEAGLYKECAAQVEEAMKLLDVDALGYEDAHEALLQLISEATKHMPQVSEEEARKVRHHILETVPRYRPSIDTVPNYFTVGHENPQSLYDNEFEKHTRSNDDTISFFLGGIGDARHLYKTMIDLNEREKLEKAPERKYHFTTNDINKCVLARDLIVWVLLEELSAADQAADEEAILTTIFFVYLPIIMPPYAHEHLVQVMERTLAVLQSGNQPVNWVHLHGNDIPKLIEVLEHWLGEGRAPLTTTEAMRGIAEYDTTRQMQQLLLSDFREEFCRQEKLLYGKAAFLYPPENIFKLKEPLLWELTRKQLLKPDQSDGALVDYLSRNWKFNPTMMDLDRYRGIPREYHYETFEFYYYPPDEVYHFQPDDEGFCSLAKNPSVIFDYLEPFFRDAAQAIKRLKNRVTVEVMHGDVMDIAERLQFDICFHKQDIEKTGSYRPKHFPIQYDRIHVSNIPDYVGGHLSTFLYTMSILKREPSSTLQSVCLRNAGVWDCLEEYLADYQCITSEAMLRKLTGVAFVHYTEEIIYPLAGYQLYNWATPNLAQPFSELLPKTAFQKWLYALFFRIALPFQVNVLEQSTVIHTPLNLTIIFRLMTQLRNIGYPSHWMSEVLSNIIENKVLSSCRPPRSTPTTVKALEHPHEARKLCTLPFCQEMATLAAMFTPLLPFIPTSPILPSGKDIYKYTYTLHGHTDRRGPNNLAIVFGDHKLAATFHDWGRETFAVRMRRLLDSTWGDEVDSDYTGADCVNVGEPNIMLWTTFEWNAQNKEISVWMDYHLFDTMSAQDWACGLFRTDTWDWCWRFGNMVSAGRKGERWEQ